ncbi:MAG TPA: PTS sugar transporter subunit IIA [Verrucomicrobiae bacterium]|nr:PTS sugar transporter subunit IIA [Verrucomicrobiae bacterium]
MELRVREVAKLFAVPERRIYEWIKERGLPAQRISGQHRFNRVELLEWATAHQVHVSSEIFADAANGSAHPPGFAEALQAGGIFHSVGVSDRESALRTIVTNLPLPADVDREFLVDLFLAREALASTGIGDGIAIPHVRTPIVLHVRTPLVSLCLLAAPVEFGAMDGKPVHALFSLISPTVRTHLHLLSRLAFALRDAGFKGAITRHASAEEILNEARRVEAGLVQPVIVANKEGQR